jgi:enoyl-CoA hydratase/carnithine racemase
MTASIREAYEDGVLTLTLDRPERRNALDVTTITNLRDRLVVAGEDRAARVVVLAGAGGAFSAGADIREAAAAPPEGDVMEQAYNPAIRAIRRMPKPVIAAIDGVAAGYGASLALAADIRLASARATLSLVFVRIGLALDGGASWFLPRLAGLRAYELAMTGELIPAERAERLGLVNHVFADATFAVDVRAFAQRLAAGPPLALAAIKRGIDRALATGLDAVLEDERVAQRALFTTRDFAEGVAAFIGKRVPEYSGE